MNKTELDLRYVRFKLVPTYSCYLCRWQGSSDDIGRNSKKDEHGQHYDSLYCPKCSNDLLSTQYEKVYYG